MEISPVTLVKRVVWPFSGIVGLICGIVSAAPVLVFGLAVPGYIVLPLTLGVGALVTVLVVYWSQVLLSRDGTGELPPMATIAGLLAGLIAVVLFLLIQFEPSIPFLSVLMFVLSVVVVSLFVMLVTRFRRTGEEPAPVARMSWDVGLTLLLAAAAWLLLVGSVFGLVEPPFDSFVGIHDGRVLPVIEIIIALSLILMGWHLYQRSKLGLDAAVTLLLVGVTPLAVLGVVGGFCSTAIRCVA